VTGRLTQDGLARLAETAARHVGDAQVPGLVYLMASGEQVAAGALGRLTIGGAPVRRDSLFRVASITKPITAAATLVLAAEGLLDLDEPAGRLLPELAQPRVLRRPDGPLGDTVPAARPVTTRDLLTFTFGFGGYEAMITAAHPWPVVTAARELDLGTLGQPDRAAQPSPDTWMARLGSLPLIDQPGARWMYNTGSSVLGVLCARAAGQAFADVLRTRVFEPLGMTSTGFWTTEPSRLATAYRPEPDGLRVWDEPGGLWSRPPAFCDGASGLVSTADDLLAFARMLLGGGAPVLGPVAARAMTTGQLTSEQRARGGLLPGYFDDQSWSFGQMVHDNGAFGWNGGFGSTWLVDPGADLIMIVLTQRMFENPVPPQAHQDIQAAARAALKPA
jgi:CubicO group peptidase (beta-lactamase class C family)